MYLSTKRDSKESAYTKWLCWDRKKVPGVEAVNKEIKGDIEGFVNENGYVFKYDNGPDYIQEGLFRIMNEDGLVGFADSLGNVVIKPQFKFANPFENGKAKVTFSGENKEVPDSKGEKHYWDSSNWYYINKNDKIINK